MPRFVLIALLLITSLLFADLIAAQERGRGTISGTVTAEKTGEPLHGAHVFLSGTKIGTVTNPAGRFQIRGIPAGNYRLVISSIGYKRLAEDLTISPGENLIRNEKLPAVVYELDEIFAGNLDERWQTYLERFERLFLGETQLSDSVKILNPEVLRFDRSRWGRFRAEALAPLRIENRALGYEITYFLDDFSHSGTVTRWDGEPLFAEMVPDNEQQAAWWEENRRNAFLGSYRHFLISLVEGSTEEEEFRVYLERRGRSLASTQQKVRVDGTRITEPAPEEFLTRLRFNGVLEVIYLGAGEDPDYIRWRRGTVRMPSDVQSSHVELNKPFVTIDADGEISETYGTTRYGYFSFKRFADKTPREYRPGN